MRSRKRSLPWRRKSPSFVPFATHAAIWPNEIHFGRCYNTNNNTNANRNDKYSYLYADRFEIFETGTVTRQSVPLPTEDRCRAALLHLGSSCWRNSRSYEKASVAADFTWLSESCRLEAKSQGARRMGDNSANNPGTAVIAVLPGTSCVRVWCKLHLPTRTTNPSRRAALVNRASRHTISRLEGSWSAAISAAASCRLSAAHRGCVRSKRSAVRRTASDGTISCQLSASRRAIESAVETSSADIDFSRSSRASADAISIGVPHQMSTCGSSCRICSIDSRVGSSASSGRTAEESQNFIAGGVSSALVPIGLQRSR